MPTEQCSRVASSTSAWTVRATCSGSSVSMPTNASSQPSTSTTAPGIARRVSITTADAASYAGPSTGSSTASGHRRTAVLQRHPGAHPELAGLVGRGRDDGSLGRVAASADDHRQPGQLGASQDLHRRDELVHVDVQHPVRHGDILPCPRAHLRRYSCTIRPRRTSRMGGWRGCERIDQDPSPRVRGAQGTWQAAASPGRPDPRRAQGASRGARSPGLPGPAALDALLLAAGRRPRADDRPAGRSARRARRRPAAAPDDAPEDPAGRQGHHPQDALEALRRRPRRVRC